MKSKILTNTLCFTFGLCIQCLSFEKWVEKGTKVKWTAQLNLQVEVCITVKFNSLYHIYWDLWIADWGLIHSECRMFPDSVTKHDTAVNSPWSKKLLVIILFLNWHETSSRNIKWIYLRCLKCVFKNLIVQAKTIT